jgi:hypothetical protein
MNRVRFKIGRTVFYLWLRCIRYFSFLPVLLKTCGTGLLSVASTGVAITKLPNVAALIIAPPITTSCLLLARLFVILLSGHKLTLKHLWWAKNCPREGAAELLWCVSAISCRTLLGSYSVKKDVGLQLKMLVSGTFVCTCISLFHLANECADVRHLNIFQNQLKGENEAEMSHCVCTCCIQYVFCCLGGRLQHGTANACRKQVWNCVKERRKNQ